MARSSRHPREVLPSDFTGPRDVSPPSLARVRGQRHSSDSNASADERTRMKPKMSPRLQSKISRRSASAR
jgi:hypothetical protein